MKHWSILQHKWTSKHAKRNQTQKVMYCMILSTWNIQNRLIHRDRGWMGDFQRLWEGENEEQLTNGHGVSFWADENVSELEEFVIAQHCECMKFYWTVHFKMVNGMCISLQFKKLK